MRWWRGNRRLLAIATLALVPAGAAGKIFGGSSRIESWSLGTAYAAVFLLAASMLLGPLNVLRGAHNPVHVALRRDIGIAAAALAIVHTVLGLQVHMGGNIVRYFSFAQSSSNALKAFVAANFAGLLSVLVLAGLIAISNDRAIRRLGLRKWKSLQRLAYLAGAAAILHGLTYQLLESRAPLLTGVVAAAAIVVTAIQLWAARIVRARRRESSRSRQGPSATRR